MAISPVQKTLTALVYSHAKTATYYAGPSLVVRLTRQGTHRVRDRQQVYVLTIGKPNYAARKFIKVCQRAGEPFPIKKVQLK